MLLSYLPSTMCNTSPPPDHPSAAPAHELYVELATRITTQRLHYRSGDEETAATSLHSLFKTTRDLMAKHPKAYPFHAAALILLNDILRPYTARWHGWMTQDGDKVDRDGKPVLKMKDEWVRRKFREELRELQPDLIVMRDILLKLSTHTPASGDWLTTDPQGKECAALKKKHHWKRSDNCLGASLPLKIRPQIPLFRANPDGRATDATTDKIETAERNAIAKRRNILHGVQPNTPVTDVVGLALSGGGIRSATFCLGIVQTLQRRGLFNHIDYLSTVSGGGYLGTFLSSYLGTNPDASETKEIAEERVKKALEADEKGGESAAIRHLRNNSKYLLNGGGWALLRIGSVMVTGFLTSLLMLLTVPLLMAWVTLFMKLLSAHPCLRQWVEHFRPASWVCPFFSGPFGLLLQYLVAALALFWFLLVPFTKRLACGAEWESKTAKFSRVMETISLWIMLITAVIAGLYFTFPLVEGYEVLRANSHRYVKELIAINPPEWLVAALSGLVPILFGTLTKRKDGTPRKWAQWLFYLTGPLFFLFTFLIFASYLGVGNEGQAGPYWPMAITVGLLVWAFGCLNINTFAPHRYYRDRLCECYLAMRGKSQRSPEETLRDKVLHGDTDQQELAPSIGTARSLALTNLSKSVAAPYHLINATLNAAASKNPELRGRNGDFFLFSRHFCGSPLTGYISTEDMQAADPAIDLGTAMAISGAAASTNMGWKTLRSFRFLMTLFNVRLGYWMNRPGRKPCCPKFAGPGPIYFLREMLGAVHERSDYVNLSDGGHLENLAVYELLRRQCKFIICVDAGMEPGMECSDLMRLQRYAEIDLGIQMHFDTSDLTLLPTSYSRAYAILVKIDYAPHAANVVASGGDKGEGEGAPVRVTRQTSHQLGWMLYLKLAVTGTEPRHVLDYRRQNPAFPHQTTGDQLYDEAQFESYRALGQCAADSLFREEITNNTQATTPATPPVTKWFQQLATSLLPDNDEVFRLP